MEGPAPSRTPLGAVNGRWPPALPRVSVPPGLTIAADDPDLVFTGMMDGTLWKSEDGGRSFERILEGCRR